MGRERGGGESGREKERERGERCGEGGGGWMWGGGREKDGEVKQRD